MAEDSRQQSEHELQKLSDELVEHLSGGYIHYVDDGEPHRYPFYEIIDRNGDVIDSGYWQNNWPIEDWAKELGVSSKVITDEELDRLRRYRAVVGRGF